MLIEPQLGVKYGPLGDFDGTECGRPSDFGRAACRVVAWRGDDWELNHDMRDVPGSSSTESSADPEEGHDLSWCGRLWSILWGGLSGW